MSAVSSTELGSAALREVEATHGSGVYRLKDLALVRGEGARVWDAEGREYIDCATGHGVANVGHAQPAVVAAIREQAGRLLTCAGSFPNDRRAELFEALARFSGGAFERFFLCNSGTEAVEATLKFARLATGRPGLVAATRGFHGRTLGALSVTWNKRPRTPRAPFASLVPGVSHARFGDLAAFEAAVDERTAAVIVEVVQGEGGVHVAAPEFLHGLRTLCDERGALLIVDEVQTGFGRTGRAFAYEHFDLRPDLVALGKALAGGLPMGAVMIGERVGELPVGCHGSTFGGNPLACAAALATIEVLERERWCERADELGSWLAGRLTGLDSPLVREVRGLGLMIGLDLRCRVAPLLAELQSRGVLALAAGPTVLRLLPPLMIDRDALERVLEAVETVVAPPPATPSLCLLHDLVATPSLSTREAPLAKLLTTRMTEYGLDAHIDGAGNAVGIKRGAPIPGSDNRCVVLLGHMDTVPGAIPVRIEDGKLYGRGAVDAKGPLATFVRAVAEVEPAAGVTLVVIGAVEEETASSRGAHFVAPLYRPEVCLIGEPSGWDALTLGYKGRLLVELEFEQPCGHSAGPVGAVSELAAAVWEGVRGWCDEFNGRRDRLFDACLPSLSKFVTESDGLRDRVELRIGFRLPPEFDAQPLRARIDELAAGARVRWSGEERAWTSPRTSPLARAFSRSFADHGLRPRFKHKTGTSDMNVLGPVWECPIAAYGPGDSCLDHTPEEHIVLEEYERAIEVLKGALVHGGWA